MAAMIVPIGPVVMPIGAVDPRPRLPPAHPTAAVLAMPADVAHLLDGIGVVDGDLHVSLRHAFDDPDPWGMLLADVTRHVARIYATDSNLTQDQVIERVRTIYSAEMDQPTDIGATGAIS